MRTAFHLQLEALTASVADMCARAAGAMQRATHAVLHADVSLAGCVLNDHDKIRRHGFCAQRKALALLALQAPVAGDLRVVIGDLKNIADAERMGALASHVADIARRRYPACALPEEAIGHFAEMGRIAVDLSDVAGHVVRSRDPVAAARMQRDDDLMDELHRQLFSLMIDKPWNHSVAATVDVTLLGRYYERFADHAVAIGRRVIFQARGESMSVSGAIARIVAFLRAGYPAGIPATDTFPLLALLRRRLSDGEVMQIAAELVEHGDVPVDATTIRVMISKLTDQMPAPEEVERVKRHLEMRGWPVSDEFPA
ncbi:phosphate signaling complex protein PhoU [Mycobacterium sp. 1245805.9]|uniref:phosphate signaling complex protein PhoU n=1 Tax=Mycobacterium sp. 1245805.9 TaxID=1856862 RepID=UPI0007FEF534|nr:phosphate transport system regulatory protein PhoU [Mycobacterium sp. 1245805.9]